METNGLAASSAAAGGGFPSTANVQAATTSRLETLDHKGRQKSKCISLSSSHRARHVPRSSPDHDKLGSNRSKTITCSIPERFPSRSQTGSTFLLCGHFASMSIYRNIEIEMMSIYRNIEIEMMSIYRSLEIEGANR
jgi:hypothetical protein